MDLISFWNDYQTGTQETAIYPGQGSLTGLAYVALGLAGESGELCEQVKKMMRDDGNALTPERREKLKGELGDVLWYLARASRELKLDLSAICTGRPSDDLFCSIPGLGTPTGLAYTSLLLFKCSAKFGDEVKAALTGATSDESAAYMLTDVFYVANIFAQQLALTLEEVATANRDKLLSRKERGVLGGSGSQR